jgi:hypothetical protein
MEISLKNHRVKTPFQIQVNPAFTNLEWCFGVRQYHDLAPSLGPQRQYSPRKKDCTFRQRLFCKLAHSFFRIRHLRVLKISRPDVKARAPAL